MLRWLKRLFVKRHSQVPAPPAPAPAVDGFDLIFGPQAASQRAPSKAAGTVVLIGNCVAETVARGLSSVPTATSRFDFVGVPLHLRRLDDPAVRTAISRARFIFVQNLAGKHRELLDSLRPSDSDVIVLPDASLRCAWPFDGEGRYRDDAVTAALPGAPWHLHDGALARLRQLEPDPKRRLQRYRELDFDWASRIDRVIEAQPRFLESVDETNDAHLGRFISRHFRDRQLFYNSAHPTGIVFQEICEYCWRKLQLPGSPPQIGNMDAWKTDCIPVHPLIAARLKLTWASEVTRYHCGSFGVVTWEEWAAAYIQRYG